MIRISEITAVVSEESGLSVSEIMGRNKEHHTCVARFTVWSLAKRYTNLSLTTIAGHFKRDHTTVMHGLKRLPVIWTSDPHAKDIFTKSDRQLAALNRQEHATTPVFKSVRSAA